MPLGWACHVERSAHREELSLVVEDVQLGRVEIAAACLVAKESVVFPAVPQALDHVMELLGAAVAFGMVDVRLAAEVPGFVGNHRGHQVPGGYWYTGLAYNF